MANILSAAEGAVVLRCESTDADMLALLPIVDAHIKKATGRDWSKDSTINPLAKAAARILLVRMHEDPGDMVNGGALSLSLSSLYAQLAAEALRYPAFQGLNGAGAIELPGAFAGETVSSVTGLIGVTGDQASSFESVITVDGEIQQTSAADLSSNWYRAYLTPLGDL